MNDDKLKEFKNACKPRFMVLGPQKCGTSTLWAIMSQHPNIVGSDSKEPNWFSNGNGNVPSNARCGTTPEDFHAYLSQFFKGGQQKMRDHKNVAGEWSATYLHCPCCPAVLKAFMPNLRLISILRDPIQRALSRFAEQHTAIHDIADTDGTFDDYVQRHLPLLRECMSTATSVLAQTTCLSEDNILGPSIYEIPIQNYLAHFPKGQMLVTYLDNLAAQPAAFMEKIERHLKLNHFEYKHLSSHYNAEGEYGWDKATLLSSGKTAQQAAAEDDFEVNVNHPISEETHAKLFDFYRPHVKQLKMLADDGITDPMPQKWIDDWKLSPGASIDYKQEHTVSYGGSTHALQYHPK